MSNFVISPDSGTGSGVVSVTASENRGRQARQVTLCAHRGSLDGEVLATASIYQYAQSLLSLLGGESVLEAGPDEGQFRVVFYTNASALSFACGDSALRGVMRVYASSVEASGEEVTFDGIDGSFVLVDTRASQTVDGSSFSAGNYGLLDVYVVEWVIDAEFNWQKEDIVKELTIDSADGLSLEVDMTLLALEFTLGTDDEREVIADLPSSAGEADLSVITNSTLRDWSLLLEEVESLQFLLGTEEERDALTALESGEGEVDLSVVTSSEECDWSVQSADYVRDIE